MTHSKRLQAYVQTALWSSTDNDESMDRDYEINDLAAETLVAMQDDLDKFFDLLESIPYDNELSLLDVALEYADSSVRDNDAYERIAHDFWLTRNGHGAGFWDGDYGSIGGQLTAIAETFPEVNLYIGDDGMIYQA